MTGVMRERIFCYSRNCPHDLLENPDAKNFNNWLSHFIVEARDKDSELLLHRCSTYYGHSKSCMSSFDLRSTFGFLSLLLAHYTSSVCC